ncbi:zinc finger and BTB domain-containing protein 49-like isoform X2 [Micropterus salmoides]|uniref:zinc finger and BTB domain-containing protein 49-like isoform X2 n=1 Tax=Micropterus salmoides TaxID=27706 RepID=UPI0018EDBD64|nr:zinc finger and BTB domain-containing protein 49-like isoform X2 [Micropterus salmoides]
MSQIEELKVFVSERLNATASEIVGAIEKTITDYEEQVSRLKEENDRHRSLLDIILKAKLTPRQTEGNATKKQVTPAAADPGASDSSPAHESPCHSNGLQCVFTSRTDFLKLASSGDCPYCLKTIQASETHLMRKHYLFAVHFAEGGTEKFVVPCTCKDRIQGRSHWHCPFCRKIIYRKCNFEVHISKQHGYTILQQSQDPEIDHPSLIAFEEDVPLSPEPWCQQGLSSLHQEDPQSSLLLQIKDEEEEMWRLGSHPELQNSEQLQIKGEPIQMGLEADHAQDPALNIIYVDTYIQHPSEINNVESSREHPLPNSSTQPLENLPDGGIGEIQQPAGESQHITKDGALAKNGSRSKIKDWKNHRHCLNIKPLNSTRKRHVQRSVPPLSLNVKKSTESSASQNLTGPHCCKACGKTFHYIYTLRTHAQTHTVDKIYICGICGKHLESPESLIQHLKSHTKTNKCSVCGKQFSNSSRLKRHRRFHRPKGLNIMSSAYKPQMGDILPMS